MVTVSSLRQDVQNLLCMSEEQETNANALFFCEACRKDVQEQYRSHEDADPSATASDKFRADA
jgi:hypothetical protein